MVLLAGAYVGEVIRRNHKTRKWRWLEYEQARALDMNSFDDYTYVIGTAAVLNDAKDMFTFPLTKVEKYFENGWEENLPF